jgi:hypothetical protein
MELAWEDTAVLNRGRIIELAAPQRPPTMYGWRDFANEGGLMSDDPNIPVMSGERRATSIVIHHHGWYQRKRTCVI